MQSISESGTLSLNHFYTIIIIIINIIANISLTLIASYTLHNNYADSPNAIFVSRSPGNINEHS